MSDRAKSSRGSTGSRRSSGRRRFAQWLVVGDERLLLVDSGIDGTIADHVVAGARRARPSPAEITDVVVTHADVDHYGGNAELRRVAPRRAHPARRRRTGRGSSRGRTISRERYGWYRRPRARLRRGDLGRGWSRRPARTRRSTARSPTARSLDLGGIAVEVRRPARTLARTSGRAPPRVRHGDRDGRGARAGPLHDRRRADQPAAVRIGSGLPGNDRPPPRARAQPGSARATTRRSRARQAVTAFLDETAGVRRRPRRGRRAPSSGPSRSRSSTTGAPPTLPSGRSARWRSSSHGRSARTWTTRSRRGAPCARETRAGSSPGRQPETPRGAT